MGIITKMRKQNAVIWRALGRNAYGDYEFSTPQQIVVRWDELNEEIMLPTGQTIVSMATVYLPELSTGVEADVNDFLWLGDLADAPDDPQAAPDAHQIKKFSKIANLKATEFLRTAYL